MEISSIIVKKKEVIVKFQNKQESLKLSYDLYTEHFLYIGKEIDRKLYYKLKNQSSYDTSLQWCKDYLSNHIVSTYQMKKKLENRKVSYKQISEIIKKLQDINLLNDIEYCKHVIDIENNKNHGKCHIINKLYNAGISYSLINNFLFDDAEEKKKMYYSIRNYKSKKNYKKFESKKLYIYLLQNGFDEDLINEYLETNN
ncbi:MAG: hypothetical protein ACI311_03050 [Bacilli bacterium]